MKKTRVYLLAALVLVIFVQFILAATPKEKDKINVDELTKSTQRTASATAANGQRGMNLIWYIPIEFWEASLRQNPDVPKAQADSMIGQLKGVFIVSVVRSQIGALGQFDFYDEATVRKNLTLTYTGKDGKAQVLKEATDLTAGTKVILGAMKPMLQAAMGKMGQSMYFFVFSDTGPDGKRLVPPDVPGKLAATLAPLAGEPGGTEAFQFPLNSLFVPRECPQCHHTGMDILWDFCPYCGQKLPE